MAIPTQRNPQRDRLVVVLDALAVSAAVRGIARLLRVWDGLYDEGDIEAVHRLRTGLNRMRSLVRLFGPLCGWPNPGQTERALRRWQRALSPLRDLDVLSLDLRAVADSLHGPARRAARRLQSTLQSRRKALYSRALREVQRKKGHQALQTLELLRETLSEHRKGVKREMAALSRRRRPRSFPAIALVWPDVHGLWMARKRKAEQSFHGLVLHRFRLANKRLRHVLQLFQSGAPIRMQPLYALVGDVHDSLGRLHDFEVLIEEAETLAGKRMARAGKIVAPSPAGCIGLLAALEARRREILDHSLELWKRLHDPTVAEMLARPFSSPRRIGAKTGFSR